jgi:hypothetical protein
MKKILLFICMTLLISSVSNGDPYFAPGVINKKPIGKEKTRGNKIKSSNECTKKGGKWFEEKGYYAYCLLPYADAGKLCKNSKDCIGHCIMPLDKKMLDGTLLKEGYGICQEDGNTDDCGRYQFENGKIIIFNCD